MENLELRKQVGYWKALHAGAIEMVGALWEPLCCVQVIGLLVATGVILLLVPVLYVVFVENVGLVQWDQPGTHHKE